MRKSKISAKLYEKDVKTSKETLKTCLKTTFAMEKQNNCSNVGKKLKISAMLYENILKISKEPLKIRSITAFAAVKMKQVP